MEASRVIVDKLIAGLQGRGITTFGAVGYCYGAKHVVDLARENAIASAAVAHPSRLAIPDNFHDLVQKSKAPLLINSCEVSLGCFSLCSVGTGIQRLSRQIAHFPRRLASKRTRY